MLYLALLITNLLTSTTGLFTSFDITCQTSQSAEGSSLRSNSSEGLSRGNISEGLSRGNISEEGLSRGNISEEGLSRGNISEGLSRSNISEGLSRGNISEGLSRGNISEEGASQRNNSSQVFSRNLRDMGGIGMTGEGDGIIGEDLALDLRNSSSDWMMDIRLGNAIAIGVSSRLSLVVTCLLCGVKSLALTVPRFHPHRRAIVGIIAAGFVFLISSYVVSFSQRGYRCKGLVCIPEVPGLPPIFNIILFLFLPLILPLLFMMVCCISALVTVSRIYSKVPQLGNVTERCVTILLFSVTDIAALLPFILYSVQLYISYNPAEGQLHPSILIRSSYINLTLPLYLRALAHSVLLAGRSPGLWRFLCRLGRADLRLDNFSQRSDTDRLQAQVGTSSNYLICVA